MLVIIQARTNSTRFPGKVLEKVNGIPLIEYSIRAAKSIVKHGHDFCVAIPHGDTRLIDYLKINEIPYFEGSELDVLDRFYQCAKKKKSNTIVRLCADTLYDENDVIEQLLIYKNKQKFSYGNGVFIMSFDELKYAWKNAKGSHREHVTTFLYRCVDYPEDLERSPIANH